MVVLEKDGTQNIETADAEDKVEPAAAVEEGQPRPCRSPRPDIIERYAKSKGRNKISENRILHEDGSWIAQTKDINSSWKNCNANGDLVHSDITA